MRSLICSLILAVIGTGAGAFAQSPNYRKAKVSFEDFKELVVQVEPHRSERLIDFNTFVKKSQEPNVIILDTRSDFRFDRVHLKGARHLAFTDFTQANLAKVIPSPDTTILIYCNNNFDGDEVNFATKAVVPIMAMGAKNAIKEQMSAQARPRMMALNVPTYINLFGYGYRNIYELDELLDVKDPRVTFEGSVAVKRRK